MRYNRAAHVTVQGVGLRSACSESALSPKQQKDVRTVIDWLVLAAIRIHVQQLPAVARAWMMLAPEAELVC